MLDFDLELDLSRSNEAVAALSYLPRIGPVIQMLLDIQEAYEDYVLRRFDRYSRGGGDWEPLLYETVQRKGHSLILVDSKALREGLEGGIGAVVSVGGPRGFELKMGFTVRSQHPDAGMTIADLAAIHHLGLGNVPERRILVSPDAKSESRTLGAMTRTVARIMK